MFMMCKSSLLPGVDLHVYGNHVHMLPTEEFLSLCILVRLSTIAKKTKIQISSYNMKFAIKHQQIWVCHFVVQSVGAHVQVRPPLICPFEQRSSHVYTHNPNTNVIIMSLNEAGVIKGPFFHTSQLMPLVQLSKQKLCTKLEAMLFHEFLETKIFLQKQLCFFNSME